jgi:hypothetical protein
MGVEWSAAHPVRFALEKGASGNTWVRDWRAFRPVLDAMEKRESSCSCREPNPESSVVQPVAIQAEVSLLPMISVARQYNVEW